MFGNVPLSLRALAAEELAAQQGRAAPESTVYDLRWRACAQRGPLERAQEWGHLAIV